MCPFQQRLYWHLHVQATAKVNMNPYSRSAIEDLDIEALLEVVRGETQFPVTGELVRLIIDIYRDDPVLPGLLGFALDGPFVTSDVVTEVLAGAELLDDEALRSMCTTHHAASFEQMLDAPAWAMTLHSLQAFVWKHSLATGRLWTEEQYGLLRRACEKAEESESRGQATMRQVLAQVLG